jgi:hypothetical protein
MKRRYIDYKNPPTDMIGHYRRHFSAMGKSIETVEICQYVREMVCDNPEFPEHDDATDIIASFLQSVKYGSADLKGFNIMAHTRALNAWLGQRTAYAPKEQPTTRGTAPPKPDNWQYDPNEPLPADITPERATHLLFALAEWRGGNLDQWKHKTVEVLPVGSAVGWAHYINKLKARAKKVA